MRLARCAVASLALLAAACTPGATAPSIASGERPVTGDARYDRFFAEVSELHAAVQEAKREHADVRAALARRSGVPEDAAIDALGARLRERTARLAAEGLTLELEFTGIDAETEEAAASEAAAAPNEAAASKVIPTATLRTPGREPERRELRLLEVLAQAALSGATIYADMGRVERRATLLLEQTGELRSGLGSSFADVSRRDTVEKKLAEAEAFLPDLNRQASALENEADALIAVLDEAANTAPPARRRATREASPMREAPARDAAPRDTAPESAARRGAPKTAERDPATGAQDRPKGDFEP